jgi:hypothetical protein
MNNTTKIFVIKADANGDRPAWDCPPLAYVTNVTNEQEALEHYFKMEPTKNQYPYFACEVEEIPVPPKAYAKW